ncbi:MAG: beta-hexosaminidase, partial [Xanthomonadaceae bacterium]|nr:beta-hexosaminidase [Xanthomonadaceae bacterium]
FACLLSLLLSTQAIAARAVMPSLIPLPANMQRLPGEFKLAADTPIIAGDARAREAAGYFTGYVARTRGIRLESRSTSRRHAITFAIDLAASANPEGYRLEVTPNGVTVMAPDARGLFYGAVTLAQLVDIGTSPTARMPSVRIEDAPRFPWRGLMLDSARHMQSVNDIKQLLDAMALHKLNTFHWHLTDDQGWRIEIPGYPKLTEIGGCRIPAGDTGIDPLTGRPKPYCGYYTQAQIRDIIRYAAQRHITVVPEIDIPGHAQAAVAAYPTLGNVTGPTHVSAEWGVHPYLFNADEDTFHFLESVLSEVIALFPGQYVHLGGDEAVKHQWQQSPRIQARMRELGIHSEAELQGYFVRRLGKFLHAHGRRLIGWDEILETELPADATVMSWRGIQGAVDAVRKGHDVVMSPSSDLYFDYLQTTSADEPPGRPATIGLQQVYAFEPMPPALSVSDSRHILGLQANVWTEHMRTFARVEHAVFPRIAAVAETGWTPKDRKDYAGFLSRLPAQLQRYRALGIDYAQTPFAVAVEAVPVGDRMARVTLSSPLSLGEIHYTTDGRTPTPASPRYRTPLALRMPVRLRTTAFADGVPLADPVTRRLDAASFLQRNDEALAMCSQGLMLRLEDDGPPTGTRAIYNVDIFNPCWQWTDAPLRGIAAVEVHAGRIPYLFQLDKDEVNRKFHPASTSSGELEIHAGCDGALLARVPLPPAPAADGFITLPAPLPEHADVQTLCLFFTGDTRPTMWVIDNVRLIPSGSHAAAERN